MSTLETIGMLIIFALIGACAHSPEPRAVKHESEAIQLGIAQIEDELHDCYERFKVGGHIQATITIEPEGHVSSVEFDDRFTGTPTGECVREALMTKARFKPEFGLNIIRYPLLLR